MPEFRKMVLNRVWATAYNLVAIPVAAGSFLRWGLALPMSLWDEKALNVSALHAGWEHRSRSLPSVVSSRLVSNFL